MTEATEIYTIKEDLEAMIEEIADEAKTRPGNGPEFEGKLLEAEKYLRQALIEINSAYMLFTKEERDDCP